MGPSQPIGLFDSGVGGLTVFQAITKQLPHEELLYFADTAHLPYGDLAPSQIQAHAVRCSSFLLGKKIKLLVVACHTASAYALPVLEQMLPIPVLGMIQPSLEALITSKGSKKIALLGTPSLLSSQIYQERLALDDPSWEVSAIACPLFVPLVEEKLCAHPAATIVASHYLSTLKGAKVERALLACTHYPLLFSAIQKAVGASVELLDPAHQLAKMVSILLRKKQLLRDAQDAPRHQFFTSASPERCSLLAEELLGLRALFRLEEKREN